MQRTVYRSSTAQRLEDLESIVGREHVKSDPQTTSAYAVDGLTPRAVVFPADPGQVSQVVALAHREKMALVPWGAGSKIGMGHAPRRMDLVICTSRLNKILDLDPANLTATVQAGVKFRQLQERLAGEENRCYLPLEDGGARSGQPVCSERRHSGCFLPLDPPFGSTATLGGILAADSWGPRSLLYGRPRDLVLGVRYVAANGDIVGTGGKTVKNVSGYDLSKLMIGSGGTLGILCEMTLKLLPLPEARATLLLCFPSLDQAARLTDRILDSTLLPAAVEIMNHQAALCLDTSFPLALSPGDHLLVVALEGFEEDVQAMRSGIEEMAGECRVEAVEYLDRPGHDSLWEGLSNLVLRLEERFPDLVCLELSYPLSRYAQIMDLVEKEVSAKGLEYTVVAHAGSGITLVNFLMESAGGEKAQAVIRVVDKLLARVWELGGNLTVPRAPVALKPRLPVWGSPGDDLTVMKRVKQQMDPWGLFNPGRYVGGI